MAGSLSACNIDAVRAEIVAACSTALNWSSNDVKFDKLSTQVQLSLKDMSRLTCLVVIPKHSLGHCALINEDYNPLETLSRNGQ